MNVRGSAVIAIGGSAGSVSSLLDIAASLPPDLDACVLIVVHRSMHSPSMLPRLLGNASKWRCMHGRSGEELRPGHMYVAPPGMHMRVQESRIVLDRGPTENRNRPAIDPLFRSVATAFGNCAIAVVLSGALDDGAAGVAAIKRSGGKVVVQDPADAAYPDMPRAAIRAAEPDHRAAGSAIAGVLANLVAELGREQCQPAERIARSELMGEATEFSCPDCGGVLRITGEPAVPHFLCRVGHSYSMETLVDAQDVAVEHALWSALRALRERAAGARRLAARFESGGDSGLAGRYLRRAEEADREARAVQAVLERRHDPDVAEPSQDHTRDG